MKTLPVNRRQIRKDNAMTFSTKQEPAARLEVFKFEGSQQLQQSADQGATRINEQETQHDRDSRWACSVLSDSQIGRISFSDKVCMNTETTVQRYCMLTATAQLCAGPGGKQCSDRPLRAQVVMESTKA